MFQLIKKNNNGIRHGIINTAHGRLETPIFLPDATRGFIKTLDNDEIKECGIEAMVVNTYHLFLLPGIDIIKKFKGAHNFMGWNGPLLSDSGGFQVFSLIRNLARMKEGKKPLGKITDEGVWFKSPIDGREHFLSPEKSIQIQFDLGVDMMVCLDDCPPNNSSRDELIRSIERTVSWSKRCLAEYHSQLKKRKINKGKRPLIFCVIQGGEHKDLRKLCFDGLNEAAKEKKSSVLADWDGYGFGARPVDINGKFLKEILDYTADLIPKDKIRFALGIGTPKDIWECAKMGWDMFDCVIPTREGRHGKLYQKKRSSLINKDKVVYNNISIASSGWKKNLKAVGDKSPAPALNRYSLGYTNYLFKAGETLGQRIATMNNLCFYSGLINEIRKLE